MQKSVLVAFEGPRGRDGGTGQSLSQKAMIFPDTAQYTHLGPDAW